MNWYVSFGMQIVVCTIRYLETGLVRRPLFGTVRFLVECAPRLRCVPVYTRSQPRRMSATIVLLCVIVVVLVESDLKLPLCSRHNARGITHRYQGEGVIHSSGVEIRTCVLI